MNIGKNCKTCLCANCKNLETCEFMNGDTLWNCESVCEGENGHMDRCTAFACRIVNYPARVEDYPAAVNG